MTSASLPAFSASLSSLLAAPSASAPSPAASTSSTNCSVEPIVGAAEALRRRLLGLERLLDEALAEGGALCGDLVQARLSLGLSAVVGQPVFAGATHALGSLAEARGHIVQVHRLLDKTGQALGYDDSGYGDGGKDAFTSASTELRVHA